MKIIPEEDDLLLIINHIINYCVVIAICDYLMFIGDKLTGHNFFKLSGNIDISMLIEYLKVYSNDSQGVQVIETINKQCKSTS